MQFIQIPIEMITDENLSSNEFRILCLLIRYQNVETGFSFPSIEKIATDTGISIATVKRSIKHMSELQYFNISKKDGQSGKHNVYGAFKYKVDKKISSNINNRNNYESSNKSKKILKFNNYKQREYNYEELERRLLGWED